MMFSVYNPDSGQFDYYESSRKQLVQNVEKPRHIAAHHTLGATVDAAAWPLPADAHRVGSGEHAIGRIASRSRRRMGALGDTFDEPLVRAGLLVGSAFLIWKFVVKAPRRRRA